jgi:hypothetical protein
MESPICKPCTDSMPSGGIYLNLKLKFEPNKTPSELVRFGGPPVRRHFICIYQCPKCKEIFVNP